MGKGGGVEIPSEYKVHVDSNGTMFGVDANLDDIRIKEFPKIELGDINVAITELPPIDTNIAVKELPEIKIALKEIPDTRVHLPANFNLGLSVLGVCLINLSLCGEAQIITEKYVPNRMELC